MNKLLKFMKIFKILYRYIFPNRKITVLQFPVIDICNSHCFMCNVWKNKEDERLSLEDMKKILSNKIFRDIKSVGINGGEPTLRDDLFELIKIVVNNLRKLRYLNIITNGIEDEKILNICKDVNAYLKIKKTKFDVSVSLDGDQRSHDKNRGVKGNYISVTRLIQKLQENNIKVNIGSTLTKVNLYSADDVILFSEQRSLEYKIRLAVDINRLYNNGFYDKQKLDENEKFHLIQFFQKLYRKNNNSFYYSLFNQLAYQKKRIAGCSWKKNGLTLDNKGNLSFCSVKSPILGNCLKEDPNKILKRSQHIRKNIIKEYCNNCMHDLIGPLKLRYLIIKYLRKIKKILFNKIILRLYLIKNMIIPSPKRHVSKELNKSKKIIITGWWGTETHGDKAILGELFDFLNKKCPLLEDIYITHFPEMEYVIDKTIKEINETDIVDTTKYAGKINIVNFHKTNEFMNSDFIIFGGGPLQRIGHLIYIEKAFKKAAKKRKGTFIFGCGIHPKLDFFKVIVRNLLLCSNYIFFRDKESFEYANVLTKNRIRSYYACDPAINFVKKWQEKYKTNEKNKYEICTLLREITSQYIYKRERNYINDQNAILSQTIANFINKLHIDKKVAFLSMCNLWIGIDDRMFNRQIITSLSKKDLIEYFNHKYMSLHEILNKIRDSNLSLCMRYHGHLFSFALNKPFISIDYSGKGNKIENFIKFTNLKSMSIKWSNINNVNILNIYKNIKTNYENIKLKLNNELIRCVRLLESTYEKYE